MKQFKGTLKIFSLILLLSFLAIFVVLWNATTTIETEPLFFDMSERMQSRRWMLPVLAANVSLIIITNFISNWPKSWIDFFEKIFGSSVGFTVAFVFFALNYLEIENYIEMINTGTPHFTKGIVSNAEAVGGIRNDYYFEIGSEKFLIRYKHFPWSFPTTCKDDCLIKDSMKLEVTRYGNTVVRIIEY